MAEILQGLEYDPATIRKIYRYFETWHVNDDDQFVRLFRGMLEDLQWQYNHKLRVETTEFDPLVTHYLETWKQDVRQENNSQQVNASRDVTHSGSKERKESGEDTRNNTYNNHYAEKGGYTDTKKGDDTRNLTHGEAVKTEGGYTDHYTGKDQHVITYDSGVESSADRNRGNIANNYQNDTVSDKESTAGTSKSSDIDQVAERRRGFQLQRNLAGETPDSAVYGGAAPAMLSEAAALPVTPTDADPNTELPDLPGDDYTPTDAPTEPALDLQDYPFSAQPFPSPVQPDVSPPPTEMPQALNWQYLSRQQEQDNNTCDAANRTDSKDSASSERGQKVGFRQSQKDDHRSETELAHEVEASKKSGSDSEATEYGRQVQRDHDQNVTHSGTDVDKMTYDSETKRVNDGTVDRDGSDFTRYTYGKVITESMKDAADNIVDKSTTYGGSSSGGTAVARETGRDGIAAELLSKAQAYIGKTNAFKWLVEQLQDCFSLMWEAW